MKGLEVIREFLAETGMSVAELIDLHYEIRES